MSWVETDALLHVPTWSSYIGDAAIASGDLETAEVILSSGTAMAVQHGDVLVLAELQRLTGRLLLKRGCRADARIAFSEAVETARSQGAGLFLLRSACDLARLMAEEDTQGACELLLPVLDGYPEQQDGQDFQIADHLLKTVLGNPASRTAEQPGPG